MIVAPLNDEACLERLHARARAAATAEEMRVFVAENCPTLRDLVVCLRRLPQRDDLGRDDDGQGEPRIDCDGVRQRVRVMPPDPNCVERTLWYLAAAENIRPDIARSSATTRTSSGELHTFPVERDRGPVVLDPLYRGNELRAVVDTLARNRGDDTPLCSPDRLLPWCFVVAQGASHTMDERRFVRRAARSLRNGLSIGKIGIGPRQLGKLFKLVSRDAGLWPEGLQALEQLQHTFEGAYGGKLDAFLTAYATSTLGPIMGPAAVQTFRTYMRQQQKRRQPAPQKEPSLERLKRISPLLARR